MFRRALVLALPLALTGCGASPQQIVKTVLDTAQYACIVANSDLPTTPAVLQACNLDQTLTPVVEAVLADIVAAKKQAVAKELAARKCQ